MKSSRNAVICTHLCSSDNMISQPPEQLLSSPRESSSWRSTDFTPGTMKQADPKIDFRFDWLEIIFNAWSSARGGIVSDSLGRIKDRSCKRCTLESRPLEGILLVKTRFEYRTFRSNYLCADWLQKKTVLTGGDEFFLSCSPLKAHPVASHSW